MRQVPRAAAVLALALVVYLHAAPSRAGGGSAPGCLDGSTQEARAAGGDGGGPKFTDAFFHKTFSLDVSTDGFTSRDLTISIEAVCDVPKGYADQAVQLAGSDGIAVISSRTRVYQNKRLLTGTKRRTEIDGADTMHLTVRLARPNHWRAGEDDPVPTFSTRRAEITD